MRARRATLTSPSVAGDATGAQVNAPGHPGVRDYMLRYLGEAFVGGVLGSTFGDLFGFAVSIVLALLLFSAVDTALSDLIAIQFLLSRDGESPRVMQRLNSFGVPIAPIFVSTIIPALLVIAVSDMSGLDDLYAVGVVGAIAVNLGSTATDFKLALNRWDSLAIPRNTRPAARTVAAKTRACGLVAKSVSSMGTKAPSRRVARACRNPDTTRIAGFHDGWRGADVVRRSRDWSDAGLCPC